MQTGFVSYDRHDYDESIAKADEFGFDFVELMMDGNAHRSVIAADAESIANALDRRDLDAVVHFPYPLLIGSPHPHQREGAVEELKRCIEVATAIGADKGVAHPDTFAWFRVWDDADLLPKLTESVHELVAFADDQDFTLCLENLTGNYGSLDIHQLETVLAETTVSMTLDTGHAAIAGLDEAAMADFLGANAARVSHVHLNDTRHFDYGYRGRDEHLPLGYGSLDFDTILTPMVETGWDGTLSIELDTGDFDYLATSQRHLDELLP